MGNYYIYEYWRLDNNTCFYVGKGKKNRYLDLKNRSEFFNNIINKTECAVEIIAENLSEEEAFEMESYTINDYVFNQGYGIYCKGHNKTCINGQPYLVNSTWGGEGASGLVYTSEMRKFRSDLRKGVKHSPETIAKMKTNSYWKGKHIPEETKKKIVDNMPNMGGENNPMYGKKLKDYMTEENYNNFLVMQSERAKKRKPFKHTKESKQKNSISHTKWNNSCFKGVICIFADGKVSAILTIEEMKKFLKVSGKVIYNLLKSKEPYKVSNKCNLNREYLLTLDGIRVLYYSDYLLEI